MSHPHLAWRIYDQILKNHPYESKRVMDEAHIERRGNSIVLVGCRNTIHELILVEVTKSGRITFNGQDIFSHKKWGARVGKFLEPLNDVIGSDPRYLGAIRVNGNWRSEINIVSTCTEYPERAITDAELEKVKNYLRNQNVDTSDEYVMDYIRRGRWLPYSVCPSLTYKPHGWYGVVETMGLSRRNGSGVTIIMAGGKTVAGMIFELLPNSSQYPILKGWKRKRFYKVMDDKGITGYAKYQWDMPKINAMTGEVTPGEWCNVEGQLQTCSNGVHICEPHQVRAWIGGGRNMLVEMETTTVFDCGDVNKHLTRNARVKRVVGCLDELIEYQRNQNCGRDQTNEMLKRIIAGKPLPKPQVYTITAKTTKVLTRTVTVYTKAELKRAQEHLKSTARSMNVSGSFAKTETKTLSIKTTASKS